MLTEGAGGREMVGRGQRSCITKVSTPMTRNERPQGFDPWGHPTSGFWVLRHMRKIASMPKVIWLFSPSNTSSCE